MLGLWSIKSISVKIGNKKNIKLLGGFENIPAGWSILNRTSRSSGQPFQIKVII